MEGCDDRFRRLIELSAVAGGCRLGAVAWPEARESLNRCARRYHDAATAIIDQWLGEVAASPAGRGE